MHPALTYVDPNVRPHSTGRLAGWVIPAKDLSDVAGMPTTNGSPLRRYVAQTTSPFLTALQRDGAAIDGKTVTSELGATVYAEREDVPILSSPVYPGCTPGGSSTGAAVVVADGTYRAAHGSDAGGSLRVPAAACEVVGFKPQWVPGTAAGISTDGFITANVADQTLLHGHETAALTDALAYRRPRLGLLTSPLFAPGARVDPARVHVVERAAAALAEVCEIREIAAFPGAEQTFAEFSRRIAHAFAAVDPLDNEYITWLGNEGRKVTGADLSAHRRHVRQLPGELAAAWDVDAVLTPTIATDPPRLGYFPSLSPADSFQAQTEWSPWCSLFNLTGGPAIAVGPVHIGGITLGNREVLALASLVEDTALGWRSPQAC